MTLAGLKYYLTKPGGWFFFLSGRGLLNWMSDEAYLKRDFRYSFGCEPDLVNPKTFYEKIQWLKLHDRKPLYTRVADKYAVKSYIAETLGPEYVIPLVGGPWSSAEEIDFDALPEKFVLKCTHDSGSVVVCQDKSSLDREAVKKRLEKKLHHNYYLSNREWVYKEIKPQIIAEEYLENDPSEGLHDYKFWCTNGEVFCIQYVSGRIESKPMDAFFDRDWRRLDMRFLNPPLPGELAPPACLDTLLAFSEKLSAGIPFVRVDFYIDNTGRIFFGEMTFYPLGGLHPLLPEEQAQALADRIPLPQL